MTDACSSCGALPDHWHAYECNVYYEVDQYSGRERKYNDSPQIYKSTGQRPKQKPDKRFGPQHQY